jgi:hypothetical protein
MRRFVCMDVVLAPDEDSAREADASDAIDSLVLTDCYELTPEDYKLMDRGWRGYIPVGDPDCRTLAEIFTQQPGH